MKKKNEIIEGLLIDIAHREAGSFTRDDGQVVSYDEADKVVILPLGDAKGNVRKLTLHAPEAAAIYKATDEVHWGAWVSVKLKNGEVTDLRVIDDIFINCFEDGV